MLDAECVADAADMCRADAAERTIFVDKVSKQEFEQILNSHNGLSSAACEAVDGRPRANLLTAPPPPPRIRLIVLLSGERNVNAAAGRICIPERCSQHRNRKEEAQPSRARRILLAQSTVADVSANLPERRGQKENTGADARMRGSRKWKLNFCSRICTWL